MAVTNSTTWWQWKANLTHTCILVLPSTSTHCESGTVLTVTKNNIKNILNINHKKCLYDMFHVWTPTVVLKSWLLFHLWDRSWIFLSQTEKLKSNFKLTSTRQLLWLCKNVQASYSPSPSRSPVLNSLKTSPSSCCSASDWLKVKSTMGSLSPGWLRGKVTSFLAWFLASVLLW